MGTLQDGSVKRKADGKVDLVAPGTACNGKPDLSGARVAVTGSTRQAGGRRERDRPRHMIHVGIDVSPVPMASTHPDYLQVLKSQGLYDPLGDASRRAASLSRCRCQNILSRRQVLFFCCTSTTRRSVIFTDGRPLPPTSATSSWVTAGAGTATSTFLVVNSMGYTEQAWLEPTGHPHSEALKSERFKRLDTGCSYVH